MSHEVPASVPPGSEFITRPSYAERVPETSDETSEPQLTVAEMLADLTWEQLTSDGIITLDEIEADLRAKGLDPNKYDYLYD